MTSTDCNADCHFRCNIVVKNISQYQIYPPDFHAMKLESFKEAAYSTALQCRPKRRCLWLLHNSINICQLA